jgi:regulator of protease activity HflC (stomatin/prohibitin superfamily)
VDRGGRYRSDDPEKLNTRLVHQAQVLARSVTQKLTLSEALTRSREIGIEVFNNLKSSEAIMALGIEILSVSILSVKASPEMSKALEAEAREALQRRSDEAIYARRNAAVEQERRIKESELNTEIAVEEKQRQIRETKMAADLAMEEKQRGRLGWRPIYPLRSKRPRWLAARVRMTAAKLMPALTALRQC